MRGIERKLSIMKLNGPGAWFCSMPEIEAVKKVMRMHT